MKKVRIWVDESFHRLLKGNASFSGLDVPRYTKQLAETSNLTFNIQNETKPQKKKPFKFNFQI